MNADANARIKTTRPKRQAAVRIAASIAVAGLLGSVAVSCKRQFAPGSHLRDSSYSYPSPVSVSINIAASGWLVIIGGGDGPSWNATVAAVSLAAPVPGQEVNPFVGPSQPNSSTPFEFVPTGAQYNGRFQLASTDGKRSATCATLSGAALNMEIPASAIKCDRDLSVPGQNPQQPNTPGAQQEWGNKIAAQVLKSGGGAQAISDAISFMGGEQIPVDVRTSWYRLEQEVNAIAARYSSGGNPFEEVFSKVTQLVSVDNPANLAQKLLDGRGGDSGGQTAKSCSCDVSKCTANMCENPVSQVLAGIRTEAECKAKSGTSEPIDLESEQQFMNCRFQ